MKLKIVAMAAMTALSLAAGQAGAVTFEGKTGHAANEIENFSSGSLLSFDLDFYKPAPMMLHFRIEAEDLISPQLTFNSLVRNLSGLGFEHASVTLGGVSFAQPAGTVTTDGFATPTTWHNASAIHASFSPASTSQFYVGNALSVAGAVDWTLSLAGRQAGDTFTITVAVPEAKTFAMVAAGLLIAGVVARRRRQG